ncbi:BAG family molecular chaperone regulator 2-like [Primulina eburnea]|uniref:BAG family molecular chaperone regulator 2-like n=1 Tax=Primulina eburnea TaxID=1245227 RepID=UPI003C6C1294
MMRMRTKSNVLPQMNGSLADGGGVGFGRGGGRGEVGEKPWELRPGGMLVQKRTEADQNHVPPPPIRVRVKYGSVYHEIHINSQATFGELKKLLAGPTGLHHQDQKLFYKDKERDSNSFLDSAGVKDKSKIVLVEDAISQEKRYLEMRKTAKMEKAAKLISEISMEVDRLAGKVSALETVVSRGGKVVEKDVVDLIELLMNQLLKLDGIVADGDVKLQSKIQVKRVQKNVEILDALKMKNSATASNGNHVATPTQQNQPQQQKHANGLTSSPFQPHMNSKGNVAASPVQPQQPRHSFGSSSTDSPRHIQDQPSRQSSSTAAVVITTQWETFDSTPAPIRGANPSISTLGTNTFHLVQPSFTWDLM